MKFKCLEDLNFDRQAMVLGVLSSLIIKTNGRSASLGEIKEAQERLPEDLQKFFRAAFAEYLDNITGNG